MESSKALLTTYCEDRHLQLPSYSTEREEGSVGYSSSVVVCDRSFHSQARHSSPKLAEEDAARVAYNSLKRNSESQLNSCSAGYGYECSSSTTQPTANMSAEVNSRNENTADYSQKLKKLCNARALPSPEYEISECDGKFIGRVKIRGNGEYLSGNSESYAQAKDYASLVALAEMGLSLLNINEREDGKLDFLMHMGIAGLYSRQASLLYQSSCSVGTELLLIDTQHYCTNRELSKWYI